MSSLESNVGELYKDASIRSSLRPADTSLACSLEDCYLLSSSSDGLECNEDICYDDTDYFEGACGVMYCSEQQRSSAHHLRGDTLVGVDADVLNLIRAELACQRETYVCDKRLILRAGSHAAVQNNQKLRTGSWPSDCAPSAEHAADSGATSAVGCAENGDGVAPGQPYERVYGGWPETLLQDRRLLVGWMRDLSRAANMQKETLFLAVSLLDRFLAVSWGSSFEPPERILQLLALACVSVAMKFEEVTPLHSNDLVRCTCDQATGRPLYLSSDLGHMEWRLMFMLDWRARTPTSLSFLRSFLHCYTVACCPLGSPRTDHRWPSAATTGTSAAAEGPGHIADSGHRTKRMYTAAAYYAATGRSSAGWGQRGNDVTARQREQTEVNKALEAWAYEILEMSMLQHCDLIHCHSTVAIACLVLAERLVTADIMARAQAEAASAAAAAGARSDPYGTVGASPTPLLPYIGPLPRPILAVLLSVTGLPLEAIAPDLQACLELLEQTGEWGKPQVAAVTRAAAAAAPSECYEQPQQHPMQQQQAVQQLQPQQQAHPVHTQAQEPVSWAYTTVPVS